MSKRTDLRYGRRGGRFAPDGYEPSAIDAAPRCEVCGGAMVVGQKRRHYVCSPPLECCGAPIDLVADPAKHRVECLEERAERDRRRGAP